MNEHNKIVPVLPSTSADLVALRKTLSKPNLNDHIDAIHLMLWEDKEYQRFWDAVYDEDAVEGSLAADNFRLAEMIRAKAAEIGDTYVAGKKLATIVKSMGVVARRYGQSRPERRASVHGEAQLPSPSDKE